MSNKNYAVYGEDDGIRGKGKPLEKQKGGAKHWKDYLFDEEEEGIEQEDVLDYLEYMNEDR